MNPAESAIAQAIQRYAPEWEPPADRGGWVPTLCPFHDDDTPSAAVSYDHDAFRCMACPARGDVIALIRQQEKGGATFAEALSIAESLSPGGYRPVRGSVRRKSGRRVFSSAGADGEDETPGRSDVSARVRRGAGRWT